MLKNTNFKKFKPIYQWGAMMFIFIVFGVYSIYHVISMESGKSTNIGLSPDIIEIINYGALAPSSHNAQMWKIKVISDHEIIVMLDQMHLLPQIDPGNRESLISLGAFIENIAESAPKYNLEAEVVILAQNPTDQAIARIVFKPDYNDSSSKIQMVENIKNRHTIRTPFLINELTGTDCSRLMGASPNLSYFPLRSTAGQYLKAAIVQSTREQVADNKKQVELADWIRFSKKEAERKKDGLTPEMMGISGIAKWYVSAFFDRNSVLSKSFREQTIAITKKQAENCAGFVTVSSPDNSVESLINAGRNLERFLNTATGMRIAVQPMSSPLEESPWKEELGPQIGLSQPVQMVLRVGYIKNYSHPVSKRRNIIIIPK